MVKRIVSYSRRSARKQVSGITLAGLMITCSIITLLVVIAVPKLLSSRIEVNQSTARVNLKTLSAALETYATEGQEGYPRDLSVLIKANPPILNEDYIANSPIQGYIYSCQSLDVSGYSCSAEPQACERTGAKRYTITTGGALTETDCRSE